MTDLCRGEVKSCGCRKREWGRQQKNRLRHGESGTKLHNLWHLMKLRCSDPNQDSYRHYGGRGITVCDEWKASYEAFRDWCLANGYRAGLQIDRIDTNGNYEPSNCRFVTCRQNNNNRRNTPYLEAFGERKSLADWTRDARCQVSIVTLHGRIKSGWEVEEAIATPPLPRGKARLQKGAELKARKPLTTNEKE